MKEGKNFRALDRKKQKEKIEAVKRAFRLNKAKLGSPLKIKKVLNNRKEEKPKKRGCCKSRLGFQFELCLKSLEKELKDFR